ncbi:MAG: efflux RND transporter periplasmic adaptor subunit [Ferruginibacter sp.]
MRLLTFFLILPFFSCTSASNDKEVEKKQPTGNDSTVLLTEAQIKNAAIEMGKPEMKSIPTLLKVNGVIDVPPQNMATVSFPSGGYLKETALLPGMSIKKGQVIAIMEDPSFIQLQQDYLVAETKSQLLFKEYTRQKLLNETKATSDKVLEQVTSEYNSALITSSAFKQKLLLLGINPARLTAATISSSVPVLAPISGFVSSVNVNVGKYVNPTDVLFELVNTDDLHIALTVFEKDLPLIRTGQKVVAYLTGDSTKSFYGSVVLVSKALDSNRSAMVHCHFANPVPKLIPGTFLSASIYIDNSTGIGVPDQAIVQSGNLQYIFVQTKTGEFTMKQVAPTVSHQGFTFLQTNNQDLLQATIIKTNAYAAFMKLKNKGAEE